MSSSKGVVCHRVPKASFLKSTCGKTDLMSEPPATVFQALSARLKLVTVFADVFTYEYYSLGSQNVSVLTQKCTRTSQSWICKLPGPSESVRTRRYLSIPRGLLEFKLDRNKGIMMNLKLWITSYSTKRRELLQQGCRSAMRTSLKHCGISQRETQNVYTSTMQLSDLVLLKLIPLLPLQS
ncbi:hypothetical protein K474DRAFT_1438384 [Panus rudis PR-1116 ss-1]|nr:hypothetical protein K474DRAFT_1438384 [Panus rudis PR-1116 ss-1]